MQQKTSLQFLPAEAADEAFIKNAISRQTGYPVTDITGFHVLKRSIDARAKTIRINLTVNAFINEPYHKREITARHFKDVSAAKKKVIIIGAGPAGLFAALKCIELGIQPLILERGKEVRARRRDLAAMNKEGIVNPESNYCFGEGGAGTYSDGKLYTRSNKRGNIDDILNLFVQFGADERILYEAHPHIGTNKLPDIITAMRQNILGYGGEIGFEKKLTGLVIEKDKIRSVQTADGDSFEADAFILATGHSARDVFELLHRNNITIESKPFALGVRIEHPQSLIDNIQYHCHTRDKYLPPSSYSLVQQVSERGVFSFCMCPGGIIAPAATAPGEIVVNGWSPSKRNNPYANSGMVVQVELEDAVRTLRSLEGIDGLEKNPLALMYFQQLVEKDCFTAGGGKLVAPAQRMADFSNGKLSASLPSCSYLPGLHSYSLQEVLPGFIYESLAKGFIAFGKKMKGYFTNEAIVVATESRTSSPVRIPRNPETLTHPQLYNFYPCGEGAGYAGGIVSAAMDGERVAVQLARVLS
jgi:uncharacterized FAD-dependent dehydrogenase